MLTKGVEYDPAKMPVSNGRQYICRLLKRQKGNRAGDWGIHRIKQNVTENVRWKQY